MGSWRVGEDVIFPASSDRNTVYPRWLISFFLGLSSPLCGKKNLSINSG
jgi:hypothetical protein